jgi:hypothetical protein
MDLSPEPLPKNLYQRAIADSVLKIGLHFSGGDDQGYLNICLERSDGAKAKDSGLENAIEEWAWDVYDYSGAGGGDSYGDDIVYDLRSNKVTSQNWYTARQEDEEMEFDLSLDVEE